MTTLSGMSIKSNSKIDLGILPKCISCKAPLYGAVDKVGKRKKSVWQK